MVTNCIQFLFVKSTHILFNHFIHSILVGQLFVYQPTIYNISEVKGRDQGRLWIQFALIFFPFPKFTLRKKFSWSRWLSNLNLLPNMDVLITPFVPVFEEKSRLWDLSTITIRIKSKDKFPSTNRGRFYLP